MFLKENDTISENNYHWRIAILMSHLEETSYIKNYFIKQAMKFKTYYSLKIPEDFQKLDPSIIK